MSGSYSYLVDTVSVHQHSGKVGNSVFDACLSTYPAIYFSIYESLIREHSQVPELCWTPASLQCHVPGNEKQGPCLRVIYSPVEGDTGM